MRVDPVQPRTRARQSRLENQVASSVGGAYGPAVRNQLSGRSNLLQMGSVRLTYLPCLTMKGLEPHLPKSHSLLSDSRNSLCPLTNLSKMPDLCKHPSFLQASELGPTLAEPPAALPENCDLQGRVFLDQSSNRPPRHHTWFSAALPTPP